MLTVAFDEATMSRIQLQLWYNQFKEGRWSSRTDENIKAVKEMILDNRRITI